MSAGIDYGFGKSNIDEATGIRYGVISQHSVGEAWYESAEPDYGQPIECECPKCETTYGLDGSKNWGDQFTCDECGEEFDIEFPDFGDPVGWAFESEGYSLTDCLDADIMILRSPFYTFAEFCSPCVPGAGNLDSPNPRGVKSYCLNHDWFEEDRAPYPVYRVADGSLVEPPRKE